MPRWAQAGLWAAALSGIPSSLWTLARGGGLTASTEAVGADALGLVKRDGGRYSRLTIGGIVHLLISLFWTYVLRSLVGSGARGSALRGAVAGIAIGLLDLRVIGRRLPRVSALSLGPQLADHAAFGAIAGWQLSRASGPDGSAVRT